MAMFDFSVLTIPHLENTLAPDRAMKLLHSIASLLMGQRLQVFNDEGGTEKWQPLSGESFAARIQKVKPKKRNNPGAVKMLQDSGVLRQSFTSATGAGNAFREVRVTPGGVMEVALATHVEYAAIHNFGGTIQHPGTKNGFGRGITIPAHPITIPARPFDQFSTGDMQEINELVEVFINGKS